MPTDTSSTSADRDITKCDGEEIESCTIIMTESNDPVSKIHDRMPVILPEEDYDGWLDPKLQDEEELKSLLMPYALPLGEIECREGC